MITRFILIVCVLCMVQVFTACSSGTDNPPDGGEFADASDGGDLVDGGDQADGGDEISNCWANGVEPNFDNGPCNDRGAGQWVAEIVNAQALGLSSLAIDRDGQPHITSVDGAGELYYS